MQPTVDGRKMENKKTSMHICAFLTVVLWALGYVMTRIAVQYFTTEALSFLRYFIAAVSLSVYAALNKKMRFPKLKELPLFFLGGAIGFSAYVYFLNEGSKTLTASMVSFIISVAPILTALLSRILLKEKIGLIGWVSVICAFSGVGIITYYNGGFNFTSGVIWICLSVILISVYNIYQRKLLLRYSPLEITTYCIIAGAIMLSVFAPQSFPQLIKAEPIGIIAIITLGVFSASIAYLLWAYALSKADKTSEVTNYMFVTPLLTTLLGFILINESPHFTVYIGGVLVLTGVLLIKVKR